MECEVWRIVPSVPFLMASSLGRIMVIPSMIGRKHYQCAPRIGQWIEDESRYIVTVRGKSYKVARLVCEAFNGPAPSDRHVAMHLDENSRNNHASNLQWGTQKENLNAPGFLEYCRNRIGENNPFIKGRKAKGAQ